MLNIDEMNERFSSYFVPYPYMDIARHFQDLESRKREREKGIVINYLLLDLPIEQPIKERKNSAGRSHSSLSSSSLSLMISF